jgi:hypothetical protein
MFSPDNVQKDVMYFRHVHDSKQWEDVVESGVEMGNKPQGIDHDGQSVWKYLGAIEYDYWSSPVS